jgi:mannitol-1-phosphate 5-dehydrogenase
MCKTCVIIGAGQTGRGFIAPFMKKSEYKITFLDINKDLVEKLNNASEYTVQYHNNEKSDMLIKDFECYSIHDDKSVLNLAEADVVLTAVGNDNIKNLYSLLEKAIKLRKKTSKLTIILCENGINAKKPLVELDAIISEACIFCTTLNKNSNSLDILSQVYPDLPFDCEVEGIDIQIQGLTPTKSYSALIERKIYTYNCLSACVAYVGAYKGYEIYGEAANDKDISYLMANMVQPLNIAISKIYNIPIEEQITFSQYAVEKFQNLAITDTIERNTRETIRKLGPTERMIAPLRICLNNNLENKYLELVIAAAIWYGNKYDHLPEQPLSIVAKMDDLPSITQSIYHIQELFEKKDSVYNIIKKVEN